LGNNNQLGKIDKMFVLVNFDIFQLHKIDKIFVLTNSDIFQLHIGSEQTFLLLGNNNQLDKDIGLIR
jgi:hypothetical protein